MTNTYFKTALGLTTIVVGLGLITVERANADHVTIDWKTDLSDFRLAEPQNIGQQYNFRCPPAPNSVDSTPFVFGTDDYTTQSDICPAALHAGIMKWG